MERQHKKKEKNAVVFRFFSLSHGDEKEAHEENNVLMYLKRDKKTWYSKKRYTIQSAWILKTNTYKKVSWGMWTQSV